MTTQQERENDFRNLIRSDPDFSATVAEVDASLTFKRNLNSLTLREEALLNLLAAIDAGAQAVAERQQFKRERDLVYEEITNVAIQSLKVLGAQRRELAQASLDFANFNGVSEDDGVKFRQNVVERGTEAENGVPDLVDILDENEGIEVVTFEELLERLSNGKEL